MPPETGGDPYTTTLRGRLLSVGPHIRCGCAVTHSIALATCVACDCPTISKVSHSRRAGALTIREVGRAGIRSRQISAAVRDGHWQRATPAVVVTHALAIDRTTELWVASLHFDGFVLGGTSALEVDGLPTPSSRQIHLIGPRGGQKPPAPNWILHTSTSHVAAATADRPPAANSSMAVVKLTATGRQRSPSCTRRHMGGIQQRLTSLESLRSLCDHSLETLEPLAHVGLSHSSSRVCTQSMNSILRNSASAAGCRSHFDSGNARTHLGARATRTANSSSTTGV